MHIREWLHVTIGLTVFILHGQSRNDRGLSQSAENAILLAGAVTIATLVIFLLTGFVRSHMPK